MFQAHKQFLRCAGAIFLLVAFVAVPTFSQDIKTNYMPGVDFTKYKTYRWGNIQEGAHPNQIVDAEIKSAVDKQLAAKGLVKTDTETADLTVAYQTAVNHERQWNGFGSGGWRFGGGMATATSTPISVGTIVLDFYDPAAKQLVWEGRATKAIDPSGNQEKTQKNLDKTMQKLLKNYPPKQK